MQIKNSHIKTKNNMIKIRDLNINFSNSSFEMSLENEKDLNKVCELETFNISCPNRKALLSCKITEIDNNLKGEYIGTYKIMAGK